VVGRAKVAFANIQFHAKDELMGPNKEKALATINSYYGHFRYAASYRLRNFLFTKYLSDIGFAQDKNGKVTDKTTKQNNEFL